MDCVALHRCFASLCACVVSISGEEAHAIAIQDASTSFAAQQGKLAEELRQAEIASARIGTFELQVAQEQEHVAKLKEEVAEEQRKRAEEARRGESAFNSSCVWVLSCHAWGGESWRDCSYNF